METAGLLEMPLDDILENIATDDPLLDTGSLEDDIRRAEIFETRTQLCYGSDVALSLDDERASHRPHRNNMVTSTLAEEELVLAIMCEEFDEIMRS